MASLIVESLSWWSLRRKVIVGRHDVPTWVSPLHGVLRDPNSTTLVLLDQFTWRVVLAGDFTTWNYTHVYIPVGSSLVRFGLDLAVVTSRAIAASFGLVLFWGVQKLGTSLFTIVPQTERVTGFDIEFADLESLGHSHGVFFIVSLLGDSLQLRRDSFQGVARLFRNLGRTRSSDMILIIKSGS